MGRVLISNGYVYDCFNVCDDTYVTIINNQLLTHELTNFKKA